MSSEGASMVATQAGGKSPKSSRFVSTLKRFLNILKAKDDGLGASPSPLASDVPMKTPRFAAISTTSLEKSSIDSLSRGSAGYLGALSFRLPFGSQKAYDRPPLAQATGASARGRAAALQHSHSGPCDASLCQLSSSYEHRPGHHPPQPPKGAQLSRHASILPTGSWEQPSMRSAAVLPPLPPSQEADRDSGAASAPHPRAAKGAPDKPAVKPAQSSEPGNQAAQQAGCPGACAAPGPVPVPAPTASAPPEAPAAEPQLACRSMLLAVCPGLPAAMQRQDWSLEDYDVSCRIYKSTTAAVYKATCRRSGLPVALKVYFLSRVPANVIHMIVREVKIHAPLVHKNIVMLYGVFQDEKLLVLVQEFAARGDLFGIYRSMNQRMSEGQLTELVLAPFLNGLAYLHARGICHRDIKPENILFTQDWRLVIADFGVSIDLNEERAVTRAGTLEYMAPEVERCPLKALPEDNKENESLAYTTAVDVWAVGVLAYELLVGFPPFVADPAATATAAAAAAAHHHHHPQAGTAAAAASFLAANATCKSLSFPASTSSAARDFIRRALAERPEDRPTAQQLLQHPWLAAGAASVPASSASAAAAHRVPVRRSSGQLSSNSQSPLLPSRLGSISLASGVAAGNSNLPIASAIAAALPAQ
ncbi:hypothetical protein Agub_g14429 [Astrephomene gubernaculifera]|uniref:Protein kinase domain-containing protein n=1 Tax=Astrephomene gubernaculifera TaxID=47775 RepID=A0AAD3E5Q4_9CHLO|nr:hypothetical protein Agub_g14429 [Astrephomene gubernaculifera]